MAVWTLMFKTHWPNFNWHVMQKVAYDFHNQTVESHHFTVDWEHLQAALIRGRSRKGTDKAIQANCVMDMQLRGRRMWGILNASWHLWTVLWKIDAMPCLSSSYLENVASRASNDTLTAAIACFHSTWDCTVVTSYSNRITFLNSEMWNIP